MVAPQCLSTLLMPACLSSPQQVRPQRQSESRSNPQLCSPIFLPPFFCRPLNKILASSEMEFENWLAEGSERTDFSSLHPDLWGLCFPLPELRYGGRLLRLRKKR